MYKYEIAVSYESESESYVKEVVDYLLREGWRVFFAPYRQDTMISGKLKPELYQIYQNESLVDVLFVTEKYLRSQYTQLEKRSALRCARTDGQRMIIVNFIEGDLPEELKEYVYVNGDLESDEVADIISKRVKQLTEKERAEKLSQENADRKNDLQKIVCKYAINEGGGTQVLAENVSIEVINNRGDCDGRK